MDHLNIFLDFEKINEHHFQNRIEYHHFSLALVTTKIKGKMDEFGNCVEKYKNASKVLFRKVFQITIANQRIDMLFNK